MVFSGRPSLACTTCKQKRIKCDEQRPSCSQCIKYRRECGYTYTDRNDVLFRHETGGPIRRGGRPRNAKEGVSTPSTDTSTEKDIVLLDNPAQSVDQAALSFWLDGMIMTPLSWGRNVGHLELLPRMYLESSINSALAKATHCVCLAAFGIVGPENSPMTRRAFEAYGEAVSAIYYASKDVQLRTRNDTLLAILLMLVAESLLAKGVAPQRQWTAHTMGAMQIALMRGPSLLDDPIGRRLGLVIKSFMLEVPECESIHPFLSMIDDPQAFKRPEVQLRRHMTVLQLLRPRVLEALASAQSQLLDTVERECHDLAKGFEAWAHSLPNDCQYVIDSAGRHSYPDQHLLRLYNSYRCGRIFALVLQLRCLKCLADSERFHSTDITGCIKMVRNLTDEIAASVPTELRAAPNSGASSPTSSFSSPSSSSSSSIVLSCMSTPPTDKGESFVQLSISGWYLIWPLYVACGTPELPDHQRNWFRACLLLIAEKFQYRQALHFVKLLDTDPSRPLFLNEWSDDMIENVWEKISEYGCGAI